MLLLFASLALADDPPSPPPANPDAAVIPERGTVVVLERGEAVFPPKARDQGISAGGCAVRIYFDEAGVPYRVVPLQCDDVWVAASVEAGMRYRFAPYVLDGVVRKARFETAFVYALEAKPGLIPVTGTAAPKEGEAAPAPAPAPAP